MATPTITTISPETGGTRGATLLEIAGTNFRCRPTAYGLPPLVSGPTVRVTIGGHACPKVYPVSSSLLGVLTPRCVQNPNRAVDSPDYDVFPPLDVVVTNLDDSGNPIAGESATLPLGFTYSRQLLGAPIVGTDLEPPVSQVLRAFVQDLRRDVWRSVSVRAAPDFADEGASYTLLGPSPTVAIKVSIGRDEEWSQWDNVRVYVAQQDGSILQYKPTRTVRLDLMLILSAKGEGIAMRMLDSTLGLLQDVPYVEAGGNQFPLEQTRGADQIATPNSGGIEAYELRVSIRGVPLLPGQPEMRIYTMAHGFLAESCQVSGAAAFGVNEV